MAFEDRAAETDFRAGAERGDAVVDRRCTVGIGNSRDGVKNYLVIDDGIETRVREDFIGRRRPSVGDIEVRRILIRKSPQRFARGMGRIEAAHVGGGMEGFAAFQALRTNEREAADAEVAVAESGGREDKSPSLDFFIFGQRQLDVQV